MSSDKLPSKPILASTSKTTRHNRELDKLGYQGKYSAPVHEIMRHYTYSFHGQDGPVIDKIGIADVRKKLAESIASEAKQHEDELCLFNVSFSSKYQLSLTQSKRLTDIQVEAKLDYIRVFLGTTWSAAVCTEAIDYAESVADGKTVVPSLDMNMNAGVFATVHTEVIKDKYTLLAFMFRMPAKVAKVNYFTVAEASDDSVHRHVSGLSWRRADVASNRVVPFAMWAIGFDSFAFGSRPSFREKDKDEKEIEQTAGTWDVDKEYIHFYNSKTRRIDELARFTSGQSCPCPVHAGKSVPQTAHTFYVTGESAIFSSAHDMHEIQRELVKLGKRTIEKIKADKELTALFIWAVGKRRSQL